MGKKPGEEVEMVDKNDVQLLPVSPISPAAPRGGDFFAAIIEAARKTPRSIEKAKAEAKALIGHDEQTAEMSFYRLVRHARDGREVIIEGPSIRLLEACAYAWKNIIASSWVEAITDTHVIAKGRAIDLERITAAEVEVRRRITTSEGIRYSEDMIQTTAQAACAIARRNALSGIIPPLLIHDLYNYAKDVALKKAKPLIERINLAVQKFSKLGVTPEMLAAKCGKEHVNELTPDDVETLVGTFNAIRDGVTTVEQEFPAVVASRPTPRKAESASPSPKKSPRRRGRKKADVPAAENAEEFPPPQAEGAGDLPSEHAFPSEPAPSSTSEWDTIRGKWIVETRRPIGVLRDYLKSQGLFHEDETPPLRESTAKEILERWSDFVIEVQKWIEESA
ncbi:MAG: hypothetical protein DRH04_01915 [Deltaproteobacteria bacterium]|nr:MAG: hypothetical protein DRH04_01915 [Deltaproteobacteria bacterium]